VKRNFFLGRRCATFQIGFR
jgi:hypothetical protein